MVKIERERLTFLRLSLIVAIYERTFHPLRLRLAIYGQYQELSMDKNDNINENN